MKRCCLSKLPKWIKTMSSRPKRGIQIGQILIAKTIVLPVMLVGSDMLSDGGVLGQMWPYTYFAKYLARADSRNQAELNSRTAANSSSSDEAAGITISNAEELEDSDEVVDELILAGLFIVSIVILFFSTVNLLMSNPLATLVRNARTTVMMNSRELERKDVPVPLGKNLRIN